MTNPLKRSELARPHVGAESGPEPCLSRWCRTTNPMEASMRWTKPEAEIVAVTMEVTAYVATL